MKNLLVSIDNETLRKIDRGNRRKARIDQGLNDGRLNTKVVKSKKAYNRREGKKVEW